MKTVHSFNMAVRCELCAPFGDRGCLLPQKLSAKTLKIEEFWHCLAKWSQETFGFDSERGPMGVLRHLEKEVKELQAEPYDLEEYVDVLFLCFDACRRAGFTIEQFTKKLSEKLIKNMGRKWNLAPDGQPIEHVRD